MPHYLRQNILNDVVFLETLSLTTYLFNKNYSVFIVFL